MRAVNRREEERAIEIEPSPATTQIAERSEEKQGNPSSPATTQNFPVMMVADADPMA
jgi:hypothetical protein